MSFWDNLYSFHLLFDFAQRVHTHRICQCGQDNLSVDVFSHSNDTIIFDI